MFSVLICVALLLVLVALRMSRMALGASKKVAGMALGTSGRVLSRAGGKSKVGSVAAKTAGLGKKASNFAFSVAGTGVKALEWVDKALLGIFMPMALVEFIVASIIAFTLFGGISAYATNVYDGLKKTESTSQEQSKASSSSEPEGTAGTFQSTANPGIKDEEWNKASSLAKKAVNTGIAIMQHDELYYSFSHSVRAVDCSTFTSMAVELGTGYTVDAQKVTKYQAKDFMEHIGEKSRDDLQKYSTSGMQAGYYPPGSEGYLATGVLQGSLPSNALPGDILANSEHVLMYMGHRKSDGKAMIIESSMRGQTGLFKDVATTQPRTDMGIQPESGWDKRPYTLFRPYVRMK